MDLNFITKLEKEEWIALINFCTQHHSKKKEKSAPCPITWVNVMDEEDRKDLKGNRYALISTGDGALHLDVYRANDFCLSTEDVGSFGGFPSIILNEELRIFLTTRFGPEYLEALKSYHIKEMDSELAMLSQYASLANANEKSK